MPMTALRSLFTSRKTARAIFGTVLVLGTLWLLWPTFTTPEARAVAFGGAIVSVAGLFGFDIRGIALEDAARKAAPTQQVNVGSDVSNPPVPAVSAADAPPPVEWVPAVPPADRPKGS